VSQYQKGKNQSGFTEARDSELQWYQLGHMQICTSLQTDNHASTPPLSFLQLVNKAYLSAVTAANKNIIRVITYRMAAKINWHRYGTKLRDCHPM